METKNLICNSLNDIILNECAMEHELRSMLEAFKKEKEKSG